MPQNLVVLLVLSTILHKNELELTWHTTFQLIQIHVVGIF